MFGVPDDLVKEGTILEQIGGNEKMKELMELVVPKLRQSFEAMEAEVDKKGKEPKEDGLYLKRDLYTL